MTGASIPKVRSTQIPPHAVSASTRLSTNNGRQAVGRHALQELRCLQIASSTRSAYCEVCCRRKRPFWDSLPVASLDVMCAFCGNGIERAGVDPCGLLIIANWRAPREEWREQQFFTHADCLRTRMHPDAAANAATLDADWDGEL